MKGILTIILLLGIVCVLGLLCFLSCIASKYADEYWENIRKDLEGRNGKH